MATSSESQSSSWLIPPLRHYFVYSIDPAATMAWYCGKDVDETAQKELSSLHEMLPDMSTNYYIGYCSDWEESFRYHKRHQRISIRPLQWGEDDPMPSKCLPVHPETKHSSHRAAMKPSPPLPWYNCYHPTNADVAVRVLSRARDYSEATVMEEVDHWNLFNIVSREDNDASDHIQEIEVAARRNSSCPGIHESFPTSPSSPAYTDVFHSCPSSPMALDGMAREQHLPLSLDDSEPETYTDLPLLQNTFSYHTKFTGPDEMTPEDDPAFTPYVKILSTDLISYDDFHQPSEFAQASEILERIVMGAYHRMLERRNALKLQQQVLPPPRLVISDSYLSSTGYGSDGYTSCESATDSYLGYSSDSSGEIVSPSKRRRLAPKLRGGFKKMLSLFTNSRL